MGARITMPFSPFRTKRLSERQALNPATRVGGPLTCDQANVVKAVSMETRHSLGKGCELIALARLEELGKSIDGVGRELLEIVGVHDVSSLRTGCPPFLHDKRGD
jgi:hypothetical protein